jgi:hypothetical protein
MINNKLSCKIRRFRGSVIGIFPVTFHRRSSFVFRANRNFEGFFIRKRSWKEIGEKFPEHFDYLTKMALMDHIIGLSMKMSKFRAEEQKRLSRRTDYHSIIIMRDLTANQIKNLAKEKMQAAFKEEDSNAELKEILEFFMN